ncbi:MAG TPA: type IV conjugative transfer system coupling protein TraD [Burkholderiaceae bacterium]|nr:type IV conjugative transfer system coupling protein TraD [Burkholderiaceae bacterium]
MSGGAVLEAKLRPPVELWSAAVAFGCGLIAAFEPWVLMMPPQLGLICAALAFAFAWLRASQAVEVLRYQHGLKYCKVTKAAPHKLPVTPDQLYLGEGFEWTQLHTQRKVDASQPSAREFVIPGRRERALRKFGERLREWASHRARQGRVLMRPVAAAALIATSHDVWWNPVAPQPDLGGSPILHGVGFHDRPVTLRQSERNGHLLVLGTTRVGKTRLLELLASQDIHAGHVTIVIDPKGDADLMLRLYAEAQRAGRGEQFYIFHLGYPDISARYNGIGSFSRITEVATRATNPLPSSGNSAAFKEFSWRFSNIVAQAQVALGRVPTYQTLLRDVTGIDPLFMDYAHLALKREEAAGRAQGWRDRWQSLQDEIGNPKAKFPLPRALQDRDPSLAAMVVLVKELRIADSVLAGLAAAVSYEKTFYEKIIASLGPFLEKLTTGEIAKLISPDYFDPDDPRPVFDWMQIIRQGGIVYVGLDALSDAVVASAVGNAMLADLVSVGGKLYKTGLEPNRADGKIVLPTVCLHADEVNEICGPEFVPMVNKLGGSGFRITAYTQSLFDFEAKLGDRARANQIIDNFNHVVMLRVRSAATAKLVTEQVPSVDVTTLAVVSGVTDTAAAGTGIDFTSNNQDRVATTKTEMITAADILELPKGQAFALLEGNRRYKIRIPQPDAANDALIPESLRAVAEDMRARYRTSESWWTEKDWLAGQPLFGTGVGIVVNDLAPDPDEPQQEAAA